MTTTNKNNPYAAQDYALIINAFEKGTTNISNQESSLATYYKDVYSTRNFSERTQEQLNYYPGMHQSSPKPTEDPFYTNAKRDSQQDLNFWNNAFSSPDSFMNAMRDKEKDFDYQSIFGSDLSAEERAKNIGKMITECLPCLGRITDLGQLLPEGNLLEVHSLNIKARLDLLDQVKDLFSNPGLYLDICEILNLLSSICLSDLYAMLAMLTQYLAKLDLDIKFNIDFIVNLVGPILSPFLNALSQWLDKWMQLIIEPMICIVDHLNKNIITTQQFQIPFSSAGTNLDLDLGNSEGFGATLFDNQNAKGGGFSYNFSEAADPAAYNTKQPEPPKEEIDTSYSELKQAWNPTESEEERRAKFDSLIKENKKEQQNKQPKREVIEVPQNGLRWSADQTPASDKYNTKKSFGDAYNPPEKQPVVGAGETYFDPAPIADSLLQMRNILQASIQYANDWFNYITQMVYDLLSIDIGWMQKKTGSSYIKSRVLQIILLLKAIIQAVQKNNLKCGTSSNLDTDQMNYIFESILNKNSSTKFKVKDNGDIEIIPPGQSEVPIVQDLSESSSTEETPSIVNGPVSINLPDNSVIEQKAQKSGIIVKNCLKGLNIDQIKEVQSWIAEYERSING